MARMPFWQLWTESRDAMQAYRRTGSMRKAAAELGWSYSTTRLRIWWWRDAVGHAFAAGRIMAHKDKDWVPMRHRGKRRRPGGYPAAPWPPRAELSEIRAEQRERRGESSKKSVV